MRAHVPRTLNGRCIILQGRKDAAVSTMLRKKRANDRHKTTRSFIRLREILFGFIGRRRGKYPIR